MEIVAVGETFMVSDTACLGCGACSSLAPQIFTLRAGKVAITRQPETTSEQTQTRAALVNCPSSAIGVRTEAA